MGASDGLEVCLWRNHNRMFSSCQVRSLAHRFSCNYRARFGDHPCLVLTDVLITEEPTFLFALATAPPGTIHGY